MKKLILLSVILIGLSVDAYARNVTFRSTQTVCWNNERIVLFSNATFEIWQDGRRVHTGTYTIRNNNEIILTVNNNGGVWRLSANIHNGVLNSAVFNGNRYNRCR